MVGMDDKRKPADSESWPDRCGWGRELLADSTGQWGPTGLHDVRHRQAIRIRGVFTDHPRVVEGSDGPCGERFDERGAHGAHSRGMQLRAWSHPQVNEVLQECGKAQGVCSGEHLLLHD